MEEKSKAKSIALDVVVCHKKQMSKKEAEHEKELKIAEQNHAVDMHREMYNAYEASRGGSKIIATLEEQLETSERDTKYLKTEAEERLQL